MDSVCKRAGEQMKWIFLALFFILGVLGYWGLKKNEVAAYTAGAFALVIGVFSFVCFAVLALGVH